jgi:sphingolipid 4-desaturase/C4-monooxygenase
MEHHTFQGVDGVDQDIPTIPEGWVFRGAIAKFFFVLLQPLFYALRPTIMKPKNVSS